MATAILQKVVAATEIHEDSETYGNRFRCFRGTLRFCEWMTSRRTPTTPQHLMDYFGVSRATAYRWLAVFADARGLPWPPGEEGLMPARAQAATSALSLERGRYEQQP